MEASYCLEVYNTPFKNVVLLLGYVLFNVTDTQCNMSSTRREMYMFHIVSSGWPLQMSPYRIQYIQERHCALRYFYTVTDTFVKGFCLSK